MYKIALKIGKAQAADDFPDPAPLLCENDLMSLYKVWSQFGWRINWHPAQQTRRINNMWWTLKRVEGVAQRPVT